MQKKGRNAKKGRKCMFNLKIHAKKGKNAFSISKFIQKKSKNEKKKAHLFGFFSLLYPLCIFLHFKPQNSCKKDKNAKKWQKIFFKFKKKVENIISKNHAKKSMHKKGRGSILKGTRPPK